MKLEHVALHIKDRREISDFYQDILGMELVRNFTLNKTLASDIFWLEESPQVFLMQKGQVQFEVFLSLTRFTPGFSHVCISSSNREKMMENAARHSYRVLRLMREHSDLVFIWDHYGNAFEVKEASQV
jgi:catechol-2,3-dioxygenase